MPLYEYLCATCGPFRAWNPMSKAERRRRCPQCRKAAPRAVSGPHFRSGASATLYRAEAINERSANEPRFVRKVGGTDTHQDRGGHRHAGHEHGAGKLHRSRHPWMVGH